MKIQLILIFVLFSIESIIGQQCACRSTYGLSCTASASNQPVNTAGMNFMEGNWFINSSVTINNPVNMGNGINGNVNQSSLKVCSGSNVVMNQFQFTGANQFHTLEVDEGATLELFLTSSSLDKLYIVNNGTLIIHAPTSDNKLDFRNNLNQFFNNGTLKLIADEVVMQVATGFTNAGVLEVRGRNTTSGGNLTFVNSNQKLCLTGGSTLDIQGYITSSHDAQIGYGGDALDKANVVIRGKDAGGLEINGQLNNATTGFFKDPGNNFSYFTSDGNINIRNNNPPFKVSTGTASTAAGVCTNLGECIPVPPVITYTVTPSDATCGSTDGKLTFTGLTPNTPYTITYLKNGVSQTVSFVTNASGVGVIPNLGAGTYTEVEVGRGCIKKKSTATYVIAEPPLNAPAISIKADKTTICTGETVVFSIDKQTNQGISPTYKWKKNGVYLPLETGTTYTTTSLVDGDIISLEMVVVSSCLSASNPLSNNISVKVNPIPTVIVPSNILLCNKNTSPLISFTGSVTGSTFTWSNSNTSIGLAASGTGNIPSFVAINSGPSNKGATLTVSPTANGCVGASKSFTLSVTPSPVVDAGPGTVVSCSNAVGVPLAGSVSPSVFGGRWSGSGDGTFGSADTVLSNVYVPGAVDRSVGFVVLYLESRREGGCARVRDSVLVTFGTAPVADAGNSGSMCSNNLVYRLDAGGSVGGDTYSWRSLNGSGLFFPGSGVSNPEYRASPSDTLLSPLLFEVSVTSSAAPCVAVRDTVRVTVLRSPQVSAGGDVQSCVNNARARVVGSSSTGGGSWSLGSGTGGSLAAGAGMSADYAAGSVDVSRGFSLLVFSSTGNGVCSAVSDTMRVVYGPSPTVTVVGSQSVCANNALTIATATSSTGGVLWSGGGGVFSPSPTSRTVGYVPTASEVSSGSFVVVATSTGNGACASVGDTMSVLVLPSPVVTASAGPICADSPLSPLGGSIANAGGGLWSGGTGSFGKGAGSVDNVYRPSGAELSAGRATLVLSSTGNGLCNAVSDTVEVLVSPAPQVFAGGDQVVCSTVGSVPLSATVQHAGGVQWRSSGSGSFGNAAQAVTSYVPSSQDRDGLVVRLWVESTGNGLCGVVRDTLVLKFTTSPSVDAGPDQEACSNDLPVRLSASGSPGSWVGGGGSFVPDRTAQGATYMPSAGELSSGSLVLAFTTGNSDACPRLSDSVRISIKAGPVADAGPDQVVCGNDALVTVSSATVGVRWNVLVGSGSLSGPGQQSASYSISDGDRFGGQVQLELVTVSNGGCPAERDTVVVAIGRQVRVDAGPDRDICGNNATIVLSGVLENSGGSTWSGGGGSFTDARSLVSSYVPSSGEIASGSVELTLSSDAAGRCPSFSDRVVYRFTPSPTIDAVGPLAMCADVDSIRVSATLGGSGRSLRWSGGRGGVYAPGTAKSVADYYLSSADVARGRVVLYASTEGSGNCLEVVDSVVVAVSPVPVLDLGPDSVICADKGVYVANAKLSNAGGVSWRVESGSGTVSPGSGLSTSYAVGAQDASGGLFTLVGTSTGNGLCRAVEDEVSVEVVPAPVADAGLDQTTCSNVGGVQVQGRFEHSVGGFWASLGDGSFDRDSSASTRYVPGAGDISGGGVDLVFTTYGNGPNGCGAGVDTSRVTIDAAPAVDAGPDLDICGDSSGVQLSASVTSAGGVQWKTEGTGTFSPSSNIFKPFYSLSQSEINSGLAKIYVSTLGNGSCSATMDSLVIKIAAAPTVFAGADARMCTTDTKFTLQGVVGSSGGVSWSTSGTGTFLPDNLNVNSEYVPSQLDITKGSVVLTMKTTNVGKCKAISDNMTLFIDVPPKVDAGGDQELCADVDQIKLQGQIIPSNVGITWITNGNGIFSAGVSSLGTIYKTTSIDVTKDLEFILKSNTNGACASKSDTLKVSFTPVPEIKASNDLTFCSDVSSYDFSASVKNALGLEWSFTGGGVLSPSKFKDSVTYTPLATERQAGKLIFEVTSVGNGFCAPGKDTVVITLTPEVNFDAGPNVSTCADQGVAFIIPTLNEATGIIWETSGSGTFSPSATSINPTYIASSADSALGGVRISGVTTGNGTCLPKSDFMEITLDPVPKVKAGTDLAVCLGADSIRLDGFVENVNGVLWSTTGSGVFLPNVNTLSTFYRPSSSDYTTGIVDLTLSPVNVGSCNPISSTIKLSFNSAPSIDAGVDQTICDSDGPVKLQGNGASGEWKGNGIFTPSKFVLNATYEPTAAEIALGEAELIVETIKQGSCVQTRDTMLINILKGPVLDAGPDTMFLCSNEIQLKLQATSSFSTGVKWSTASGRGVFLPNNTTLNGLFEPDNVQIQSGKATLILESTGNGQCKPAQDEITLYITPAPTLSAGQDLSVCGDAGTVQLAASYTVSGEVVWRKLSGTGVLFSNLSGGANYELSAAESVGGTAVLEAKTQDSGSCLDVTDTIEINIGPIPIVDAVGGFKICGDTSNFELKSTVRNASGIEWSTLGSGVFTPNPFADTVSYYISSKDLDSGKVKFTATSTGNGSCKPKTDTLTVLIDPVPELLVASDTTVCESLKSVGLKVRSNVAVLWTGGSGTFDDPTSQVPNYQLGTQDILDGFVDLNVKSNSASLCKVKQDFITVFLQKKPDVELGFDRELCADNIDFSVNAILRFANKGRWNVISGSGDLTDSSGVATKYVISEIDKSSLTNISIEYLTDSIGACPSVSDTMSVKLTNTPTIDAGLDAQVCADTAFVNVDGAYTIATDHVWKGGDGVFVPNANSLKAQYVPGAGDIALGHVSINLTTLNNGTCVGAYSDTIELDMQPVPTIEAGSDRMLCTTSNSFSITAVSSTGDAQWSTSGSGVFSPNGLTARYLVGGKDKTALKVMLTATSQNNGLCKPVTDRLTVTLNKPPVVSAGPDVTYCSSIDSIPLLGNIQNNPIGLWLVDGSGFVSPDGNSLQGKFVPSASDRTQTDIRLTLVTRGVTGCPLGSDQVLFTFQQPPIVDAGPVLSCATLTGVVLSGNVTGATGGRWSSAGTGVFAPSMDSLATRYFLSQSDLSTKEIGLTLTSRGNGECPAVSSNVTLTLNALPVALAGADQVVCLGSNATLLARVFRDIKEYSWVDLGNGTKVGNEASTIVKALSIPHNYELTLTNKFGCQDKDTIIVDVLSPVTFNLPEHFCMLNGLKIGSGAFPVDGRGNYQWYRDGSAMDGEFDSILVAKRSGTYLVEYNVDKCTYSDSTLVTDLPLLFHTDRIACVGSSLGIEVNNEVGLNYNWDIGGTTNAINVNVVADTTQYHVSATDSYGCVGLDSVRVFGINKPVVTVADKEVCFGGSVNMTFTLLDSLNLAKYKPDAYWKNGKDTLHVKNLIVKDAGTYTYIVEVDACVGKDSGKVVVNPVPVGVPIKNVDFCNYDGNRLLISAGAGVGLTYLWSTVFAETSESIRVDSAGVYYVKKTNSKGCSRLDSVVVGDNCGPRFFLPDAFTPGSSDEDNFMEIFGRNFTDFELVIFNRWDEVVFHTTDRNKPWDGKYRGEYVPAGVYPYKARYRGTQPKFKGPYYTRGSVFVIRK